MSLTLQSFKRHRGVFYDTVESEQFFATVELNKKVLMTLRAQKIKSGAQIGYFSKQNCRDKKLMTLAL